MDATVLARYPDACPDCPDRNLVQPYRLRTADHGRDVVADYCCDRQHTWFTGWAWLDAVPHPTDDTPTLEEKDMHKTLTEMTTEIREVNVAKGWRTGDNTFGDYIALLHSELSEALEAYRDHRLADATGLYECPPEGCYAVKDCADGHNPLNKPEGVGSEFADVLIRLLDTCDVYGIDLGAEYERKIAFNRQRPYQHGGRTLNGAGLA